MSQIATKLHTFFGHIIQEYILCPLQTHVCIPGDVFFFSQELPPKMLGKTIDIVCIKSVITDTQLPMRRFHSVQKN